TTRRCARSTVEWKASAPATRVTGSKSTSASWPFRRAMSLSVASRSSRVRTWYSYGFFTPGFKCALPSASNSIGRFSKHMNGNSFGQGGSLPRARNLYDLHEVVVGAHEGWDKIAQTGIDRRDFRVQIERVVANLDQPARKIFQMVGAPLQCQVNANQMIVDDQDDRERKY